jgi:hypothetical protein
MRCHRLGPCKYAGTQSCEGKLSNISKVSKWLDVWLVVSASGEPSSRRSFVPNDLFRIAEIVVFRISASAVEEQNTLCHKSPPHSDHQESVQLVQPRPTLEHGTFLSTDHTIPSQSVTPGHRIDFELPIVYYYTPPAEPAMHKRS